MTSESFAPTNGSDGSPLSEHVNWAGFTRYAIIAAVVGLGLWLIAGIAHISMAEAAEVASAKKRLVLSYLSGFIFWFSLPVGGMTLLMIGYLCKTSWGLLLRRPLEAAIRTFWLFAVLFAPIVAIVATENASFSPYWWTAPHDVQPPDVKADALSTDSAKSKHDQAMDMGLYMIQKAEIHEREDRDKGIYGFLSAPSFAGVTVLLYSIWGGMIFALLKWGKDASDEHSEAKVDAALEKLKNFSGPGIITYAITVTAGTTLWVMSLEPSWSSTMFPVIFAVNQFLTCFAFCLAFFLFLLGRPPFRDLMRPKFQLDMATLMLAFTLFWSYTSFSQFMLVWIGNLPEEIPFYLKRSSGFWWNVSAGLVSLHFAIPFLLLLFRDVKLHPKRLQTVAVYLCVICAIDVVWWIEPVLPNTSEFPFYLMDLGSIVGIGGVFTALWIWNLKQRPLFPASQTFLLPEGHHAAHH